jgi:putative membrane protein
LDNIDKATSLTKYLSFKVNMRIVYFLLFALPLLAGASLSVFGGKPLQESLLLSYTSLFISGIISMFLIKMFVWTIKMRSIVLSMLIFEFIYSLSLSLSVYLFGMSENLLVDILAVAGVLSLILWLCIGMVLGKLKTGITIGIIQFVVFAFLVAPFFAVPLKSLLAEYAVLSTVSVVVVLVLAYALLSPVRRNFSVSGFDALSSFAGQWYFGTDDLEDLFTQVGEHASLPLGIIGIKAEKDYRVVVPYIHFGPFGKLGGSDAPGAISSALDGRAIVMHSTATHDLNPTSRNEISKIIDAVKSFDKDAKYSKARGAFIESSYGSARMHGLVINDSILVTFTRAPEITEDTDIGLGYLIMEKLKRKFKNVIVADEHNSSAEKITYFDLLSEEAKEYLRCADALASKTFALQDMECSISWLKPNVKAIASNGIRTMLFKIGNRRIAYIVIDGNGIGRKSKEALEAAMAKEGMEPIIMTTDSHELNMVSGVVNEIELDEKAIAQIVDTVHMAKTAQFSAAFSVPEVELKVLGPRQSIEIISTINSIVAVAKFIVPIALILLVLFLLVILNSAAPSSISF